VVGPQDLEDSLTGRMYASRQKTLAVESPLQSDDQSTRHGVGIDHLFVPSLERELHRGGKR